MKINIKNKKILISLCIIICMILSAIIYKDYSNKTVLTSASAGLSNQKNRWGIKNEDSEAQPDVGAKNRELLESYGGIALGNPEKKYVYLTFDEGYEAGYTGKILEVLKANDVKAAFFITRSLFE